MLNVSRPEGEPMTDMTPAARPKSTTTSTVRLEAQVAVLRALAESATLAEATPRLLEAIGAGLGWEEGAVWRVDRRANVLRCVETWRRPELGPGGLGGVSRT